MGFNADIANGFNTTSPKKIKKFHDDLSENNLSGYISV